MAQRHQRGWLKKEHRKEGETWMLYFRTLRESDGKRVENKVPIGLLSKLPSKASAWREVDRQHLHINETDFKARVTFADLANHYIKQELGEQNESVSPKSHTTIGAYRRVISKRLVPRWGDRVALSIEPLEIENWLRASKREDNLENPTLDKARRVMSLIYKHAQRYGLVPRNQESNPLLFVRCKTQSDYEALILTPEQAFAVLVSLPEPERVLALLAAGTGLRISEALGLQWRDVEFEQSLIRVRRTWTWGKVGLPKSAASQGPVPLHPLLAAFVQRWKQQTPYGRPTDWVFPSFKLKGKQPRVANMLVSDYLRPAAVKAGVIPANWAGRFGFHNFRHSLASYLVRSKTDPKTVQALLRHSDVRTTLQLYSHSVTEDRMLAQGSIMQAILGGGTGESGLSAD